MPRSQTSKSRRSPPPPRRSRSSSTSCSNDLRDEPDEPGIRGALAYHWASFVFTHDQAQFQAALTALVAAFGKAAPLVAGPADQSRSPHPDRCARGPVLPSDCPARGHCVKGGSAGRRFAQTLEAVATRQDFGACGEDGDRAGVPTRGQGRLQWDRPFVQRQQLSADRQGRESPWRTASECADGGASAMAPGRTTGRSELLQIPHGCLRTRRTDRLANGHLTIRPLACGISAG